MMVRNSPSNGDVPSYQISLTYLESYGPDTFFLYLTLGSKGQMNVMMVSDASSNDDAPTYYISLTYLERQTSYAQNKF